MILEDLDFNGVKGIKSLSSFDSRGSFTRVFDKSLFGDEFKIAQSGIAKNTEPRTLRGLHFQNYPYSETKVILCLSGSVQDVVVNIDRNSPNFLEWKSVILGQNEKYFGLLVPKGYAHGYLTLEADSTLLYFMDQEFVPSEANGLLWNDPEIGIQWVAQPSILSSRDSEWPCLEV